MRPLFVESIAVIGPGFADWSQCRDALRQPATYQAGPLPSDAGVAYLSPNERRRTTPVIRLALQVIDQLARYSSLDLAKVGSVFASAHGDLRGLDGVCTALAEPDVTKSAAVLMPNVAEEQATFMSKANPSMPRACCTSMAMAG